MRRVIRSLMNGNANAMYLSVRHHAIISCITLLTEPQVGVCDKYGRKSFEFKECDVSF